MYDVLLYQIHSIVLIRYTINLESSTYHYKLVNYKVPAYCCALKVWSTVTHLAHAVCLYLPHAPLVP